MTFFLSQKDVVLFTKDNSSKDSDSKCMNYLNSSKYQNM